MKDSISVLRQFARNDTRRTVAGFFLAVTALFPACQVKATPTLVNLGTDSDFAVLAGSGITITGPTAITGDIGTYPTPAITGMGNVTLHGTDRTGNVGDMMTAKNDLAAAYADAAGRAYDTLFDGGFDLMGQTLTSGVYGDASSLFLSGTLTLDAGGDPNAVWIFQAGSTLITASGSKVDLIGGAQASHVFWQVGSSATLGTDTDFMGNILALTSITLNTGAMVDGRLLAHDGAVTLDNNVISKAVSSIDSGGGGPGGSGGSGVPDTGSTLLMLGSGLGALWVFRAAAKRQEPGC